jgi:hypothetical protein
VNNSAQLVTLLILLTLTLLVPADGLGLLCRRLLPPPLPPRLLLLLPPPPLLPLPAVPPLLVLSAAVLPLRCPAHIASRLESSMTSWSVAVGRTSIFLK